MTTARYPFYVKLPCVMVSILAIGYLFFIGQNVISPLLIAILFAILLRPAVAFLNGKFKIPNAIASLVCVIFFSLIFVGIFYFISTQIAGMAEDWDKIKSNLNSHYNNIQSYRKRSHQQSAGRRKKNYRNHTAHLYRRSAQYDCSSCIYVFDSALPNAF